MALRCAAGDETGEVFDGVLAMDPNLETSTCYLTGMFSRLDPNNSGDLVDILRQVGEECETVDEWVLVHDHVVNCVDKLSSDLSALVQQCQDIAGPFATVQPDELSPFIRWFRQASEHAEHGALYFCRRSPETGHHCQCAASASGERVPGPGVCRRGLCLCARVTAS